MDESRFVYLDVETTGIKAHSNAIVEIAASAHGKEFYSRVKPWMLIPKEASAIHTIYNKDVEHEDTFEVVGPRFIDWVLNRAGPNPVFVGAYASNHCRIWLRF